MTELAIQPMADGWMVSEPVVPDGEIDALITALASSSDAAGDRGGQRNLFTIPEVRSLARSPAVRRIAETVLGAGCMAVKATLFDKTPDANWKVVWHQDVTIAVRERRELAGFGSWTVKNGVHHVQPPAEVLERMLAIRVHLDECGPENGPVRVIPGSHRAGRLDQESAEKQRARTAAVACIAPRGGILAFRPLLLHASSSASAPEHRRVIHLEFAAAGVLPSPLAWAAEV